MNTQLNILLVEDSFEDVDLIRAAFEESALNPEISVVTDGQKAIDYLYRNKGYKDVKEPDLILLDLNLPKKSGQDILSKIKSDAQLKTIPVVILTTSRSPADIRKGYENHTNCYICKPLNYDQFADVIKEIENFWLNTVRLPNTCITHKEDML